jgi:hypothetical protein
MDRLGSAGDIFGAMQGFEGDLRCPELITFDT